MNKKRILPAIVFSILICFSLYALSAVATSHTISKKATKSVPAFSWKDGDMVFQRSLGRQSQAIELATGSEYTHCGVVFHDDAGKMYVIEAIQPVCVTPLDQWIGRGKGGKVTVARLKDESLLDAAAVEKMKAYGMKQLDKNYDIYFNWSDEELYCSELVWKMYHAAGIDLAPLRKLEEFDLTAPIVKMIMRERYGENVPYDEQVIAPSDLADAETVTIVKR